MISSCGLRLLALKSDHLADWAGTNESLNKDTSKYKKYGPIVPDYKSLRASRSQRGSFCLIMNKTHVDIHIQYMSLLF
jgi:hypothetical protein